MSVDNSSDSFLRPEDSQDSLDGRVIRGRRRHRSFTERRRNSQTLPPLYIPGNQSNGFDFSSSFNKEEDIKEESKELFEHFVYDEISREHLEVPDDLVSSYISGYSEVSTPQGYKNPSWAKYGRELRVMADEFARTKERQRIKQRAGDVNMEIVTSDRFYDMLSELFFGGGGVTRERLVVLFFFCSDIAIRSLKAKAIDLFKKFIEWSTGFITSKVAQWITSHGGWGHVLSSTSRFFNGLLLVSACALVIFAISRVFHPRGSG